MILEPGAVGAATRLGVGQVGRSARRVVDGVRPQAVGVGLAGELAVRIITGRKSAGMGIVELGQQAALWVIGARLAPLAVVGRDGARQQVVTGRGRVAVRVGVARHPPHES
jgi:hypothetical protein